MVEINKKTRSGTRAVGVRPRAKWVCFVTLLLSGCISRPIHATNRPDHELPARADVRPAFACASYAGSRRRQIHLSNSPGTHRPEHPSAPGHRPFLPAAKAIAPMSRACTLLERTKNPSQPACRERRAGSRDVAHPIRRCPRNHRRRQSSHKPQDKELHSSGPLWTAVTG